MNGIVLDDHDIIEAMEARGRGQIYTRWNKLNRKYTKPENVISGKTSLGGL